MTNIIFEFPTNHFHRLKLKDNIGCRNIFMKFIWKKLLEVKIHWC